MNFAVPFMTILVIFKQTGQDRFPGINWGNRSMSMHSSVRPEAMSCEQINQFHDYYVTHFKLLNGRW